MESQVNIFISYAHEDEPLREELEKHLATFVHKGLLIVWHDRKIIAGTNWEQEIDKQLDTADITLLLISPDFMASNYCSSVEMEHALQRHTRKEGYVIPVILRPVYWQVGLLKQLQALPKDAKPVTLWRNRDAAFLNIAQGIFKIVGELYPTISFIPPSLPNKKEMVPVLQEKELPVSSAIYLIKIVNPFGATLSGRDLQEMTTVWLTTEGNTTYIVDSVTIRWSRSVFTSAGGERSGAVHPDANYVFPVIGEGKERTHALTPALMLSHKDRREVSFTLALALPDTKTAEASVDVILHYHTSNGLQGKLPLQIPPKEAALLARLLKTDVECFDCIVTPKSTIRGKDTNSDEGKNKETLIYQPLIYFYSKFLEYCYLEYDVQDPVAHLTLPPERQVLNKAIEEQGLLSPFLDLLQVGDNLAFDLCTGFPYPACERALLEAGIAGKEKVSQVGKKNKKILYQDEDKKFETAGKIISLTTYALSIRHILWPSSTLADFILMSPQANDYMSMNAVKSAFSALVSQRKGEWLQALIALTAVTSWNVDHIRRTLQVLLSVRESFTNDERQVADKFALEQFERLGSLGNVRAFPNSQKALQWIPKHAQIK